MSMHNLIGYLVIWVALNFMFYKLYKNKLENNDIIDYIKHKDTGLQPWAKAVKSIFILPTRIYVFFEGLFYYGWKTILSFIYESKQ